jgi:2-polyprenyl-6-hydroxyphenyl methylase/3-demethylubiquinone-9 3-methyltransferase
MRDRPGARSSSEPTWESRSFRSRWMMPRTQEESWTRLIDLANCIRAFEHMLYKPAVLASIHRVLTLGGRFFCLSLCPHYICYRTIAPRLGNATKHLSSDRMPTHAQFSTLLDEVGFRRSRFAAWTLLLTALDAMGRGTRLDFLCGGLALCEWKEAKPT